MTMTSKQVNVVILVAAILLSFGLRYFYAFHYAGFDEIKSSIGGDSEDYLQIAYTFSKTGCFGRPAGVNVREALLNDERPPIAREMVEYDSSRPPLWSFVLAVLMKLSNYNLRTLLCLRFALDSLSLAIFLQVLCLIELSLACRCAASFVFAAHPTWLLYSETFLSEPFTILVHVTLVFCLLRALRSKRKPFWTISVGVLGGLSVLAHPYYLFFAFFLIAAFYLTRQLDLKQALVSLALICAVVAPWIIRNMLLYSTASPMLTTSAGGSLAKGWNSAFLGAYNNATAETLDENADAPAVNLKGMNKAEISTHFTGLAFNFIRANWRLIPAIIGRKLVGALTPIPETARPGILETGRALFQLITVPFVLVGLIVGFGQRFSSFRLVLLSVFSAYCVMAVATIPTLRYRAPLIWVELISLFVGLELLAARFPRMKSL